MTYNVVFFYDSNDINKDEKISLSQKVLAAIGDKCGNKFELAPYPLPDITSGEVSACKENAVCTAKSAHAILFFTCAQPYQATTVDRLANSLGLYAKTSCTTAFATNGSNRRFAIVSDTAGGIAESGFRNNQTFGREAYDVVSYSELEIERVARIAYELAENSRRHVTLVDMANKLTTSKLWRKIVTDINEDYPYVSVNMLTANYAINQLLKNPSQFDIILTPSMLADILSSVCKEAEGTEVCAFNTYDNAIISQANGGTALTAYLGETTLGMYGVNAQSQNPIFGIMLSISMMLRHSLDMCDAANSVESAVEKLLSENSATLEIYKNQIISILKK
ncbi:MAG: hypothetical protein K2J16_02470 [Clostridia bacterium]|nr:hypothetical protein [Clostridia bacterium]